MARVRFRSSGFREVLFSAGVTEELHQLAARQKAALESSDGRARELAATGRTRSVFLIKDGAVRDAGKKKGRPRRRKRRG